MRLPGSERHAGRAGHRRQELVVVDRELVVEAVARRQLDRRDQVADERHRARADRPAPLVVHDREQARDRPRPPRPEQPPHARPERQRAFGLRAAADRAPAGIASTCSPVAGADVGVGAGAPRAPRSSSAERSTRGGVLDPAARVTFAIASATFSPERPGSGSSCMGHDGKASRHARRRCRDRAWHDRRQLGARESSVHGGQVRRDEFPPRLERGGERLAGVGRRFP